MRKMLLSAAVLAPLAFAVNCSDESPDGTLKEAWDRRNAPERMGYDYIANRYNYTTNISELPLQGSLDVEPWSGDYWPTHKGGITFRWASRGSNLDRYGYQLLNPQRLPENSIAYLSPAEKFDLLLGNTDWNITRKERNRTRIMRTVPNSSSYDPNYKIPTWEGLCHSWAPATLHYLNPGPITMTRRDGLRIPFGSADVKALLTYALHYVDSPTNFLGGRCNLDFGDLKEKLNRGEVTVAEYRRALASAECRDTNAGAFHIVLANQIGLMKEGFIADVTRDAEVWNQAVHRFQTEIVRERRGASPGAAPGTVRELDMRTQMTYTVEIAQYWDRVAPNSANRTVTYLYRVELDRNNNIIGGEWYNNGSKDDRPDFLWKQGKPKLTGIYGAVQRLYEASVTDLRNPSNDDDRGDHDDGGRGDHDDGGRGDDGDHDGGRDDDSNNPEYLDAELRWNYRPLANDEIAILLSGRIFNETAAFGRLNLYTEDGRKVINREFRIQPGRFFRLNASFPQGQYIAASILAYDANGRSLGGEMYEFAGIRIPDGNHLVGR